MAQPRYLLLQVRNADDPMRQQEVACFARALDCTAKAFAIADLLAGWPAPDVFEDVDVVFLGGSGEYSAASDDPWLHKTFDGLRWLCDSEKPTFASCWGFQAIARALGGRCIHDPAHAELGNVSLHLTDAGRNDPLFGPLPETFLGHAGHEDHVVELPPDAVLLASTRRVANQAFRLTDRLVYCTQFHPELDRAALIERVEAYPQYVENIAGMPVDQFKRSCQETPEANKLLSDFAAMAAAG